MDRSTCCWPRPRAAGRSGGARGVRLRRARCRSYGGYLCYIGVADWARRMGVGTRLYDQFFRQMAVDAGELGEPLPFVIWESHRPDGRRARERLGAVDGTDASCSIASAGSGWRAWTSCRRTSRPTRRTMPPPVPLQLFIKPMDEPEGAFDAERLKQVVAGLHREVYHNEPGDDPRPHAPARRPAAPASREAGGVAHQDGEWPRVREPCPRRLIRRTRRHSPAPIPPPAATTRIAPDSGTGVIHLFCHRTPELGSDKLQASQRCGRMSRSIQSSLPPPLSSPREQP